MLDRALAVIGWTLFAGAFLIWAWFCQAILWPLALTWVAR